jgi:glycosyltransferase involved in cell wall biosynthesis
MKRRLLVTAFEIPAFGGAATSAYTLYAKMRRDGVDAQYANLIQWFDLPFYRRLFGEGFGNPQGIPDVHDVILTGHLYQRHDALAELLATVAPDVVLAKGTVASLIVRAVEPRVPLVHYLAGWPMTSEVSSERPVADGAALPTRPLRSARRPSIFTPQEADSIAACDLAIASTPLSKALYERVLPPSLSTRIYSEPLSTAEWILEEVARASVPRIERAARPIDLLFVASSWTRWEKNLPMVRAIARRLPQLRVHVVGECPRRVTGAVHHGLMSDRHRLLGLMGQAKAVVVPSILDANPGVLFEGAMMGANVVASKCCGNWMLCNESLLVERPETDAFVAACARAVERAVPDHIDSFLAARSYDKLLAICDTV